jgi:hypothetical protein
MTIAAELHVTLFQLTQLIPDNNEMQTTTLKNV